MIDAKTRAAVEDAIARAIGGEQVPLLSHDRQRQDAVREALMNDRRAKAAGDDDFGNPIFEVGSGRVILELLPYGKK